MPRVFILNRGTHDYSSARRFGDLVYCTEGELAKHNVSWMAQQCQTAMAESNADDFIVIISLASLCAVACSIFAVKHKRLNLLIYKEQGYIVRKIVFD